MAFRRGNQVDFNIRATGIEKAVFRLGNPAVVGPTMRQMLVGATGAVRRRVIKNLNRRRDSGRAANSTEVQIDSRPIPTWGKIFSKLYYIRFIETGTKPFFPRLTPQFQQWAARRGLDPFAVAQRIAVRGIRRRSPFRRGLFQSRKEVNAIADRAGAEIARKLTRGV